MKVLFLDHYGVMCLTNIFIKREYNSLPSLIELQQHKPFESFNKKCVQILNSIIEETNVEIVISSDWKNLSTIEEMQNFYKLQGIIKQPIAFTKSFSNICPPKNFHWDNLLKIHQKRYIEILDYINTHPEITHWVCVDDIHMGIKVNESIRDWGLTNFVWTPLVSQGIKQIGIKEKIKSFLV